MQQVLLGMIRQRLGNVIGPPIGPIQDVKAQQLARFPLELAGDRSHLSRVAVDVERGCIIEVNVERCGITELGRENEAQIAVDLANLGVSARSVYAVAAGRAGRAACEVVVLIGRNHEQGIVLRDAVLRQAVEELPERRVVGGELLDVALFTRTEGASTMLGSTPEIDCA